MIKCKSPKQRFKLHYFFDIHYWHRWFSVRVEEYAGKDCWFKSWHIFYLTGESLILICIKCILNDTNLNNSFKIHRIKKRKKHFHQCTRGDSNRQPQQLSAGAPAAQLCWVFLLAPANMLHVSIGAHRQVIFVHSSTNLDKNMAKLSIGWSSSTDLHENLSRLFACRANALCRK